MKARTPVVSVVIGQPSTEKANGVLRYCHDLDELLVSSKIYEHKFLAIKKRDFVDPFLIIPKLSLIRKINCLRNCRLILLHGSFHLIFLGVIIVCRNASIGLMPHGSFHPVALKKNRFIKRLFLILGRPLFSCNRVKIVGLSDVEILDSESVISKKQAALKFGPVIIRKGLVTTDDLNLATPTLLEILYIGRLDIETKGLDTLLETAKLLKSESVKFRIRGPQLGSGYHWLKEQVVKYGLGDKVELSGSVFGDEKAELLKNASLFILLSRNEGVPVSVLEALSYGCPCIVTRETNVPHFESNPSPVTVVERDPSLIASAIIALLSKSDVLPDMKREAIRVYDEHFSSSSSLLTIEQQLDMLALH